MMEFDKHKKDLNQDLEQFYTMLNKVLRKYNRLMKKESLSDEEIKKMGELEHFLIEINSKISQIKTRLDHDLFGETLEEYYKAKRKAMEGDAFAKKRLDNLREAFSESIKGDQFFNWN